MQGIHNYIPETNQVSGVYEYKIAAVLYLQVVLQVNVISPVKFVLYFYIRSTQWRSWLKHCATSRKTAGSIPHGVNGIFFRHKPSGRTMALQSTQPLTNEYEHLHVSTVLKSGNINILEPSGPVQAGNGIALSLRKCFP